MYRIRSATGIEISYSSLEEFTSAVRRGAVSESDHIYHSRADRWLDVKSHPHYRLALGGPPPVETPADPERPSVSGGTQVAAKPMLQAAPAPPSADGFLVMSSGLDSPVRTAAGQRATMATPEPLAEVKPREVARVMPRVSLPLPATAAPAADASQPPAPPAPARALAPEADRPAQAGTAVAPAPAAARDAESSPVRQEPAGPPAGPPVHQARQATGAWATTAAETPGRAPARHFVIGGAVVAVLAAAVLLVWRPWSGETTTTAVAQTPPEAALAERDPALQQFAAAVVAAAAAQPAEPARPPEPRVLAAVQATVEAPLSVPAAEVDLQIAPAASAALVLPPSEISRRLTAASEAEHAELRRRLGAFSGLFTPARLATPESVRETRAAWVAAGDAIRAYRSGIARLESAYADTLLQSQRARKWGPAELRTWNARPSYAEPAETSQIADLMVDQVTEGLDLLAAADRRYQIRNGRLQFTAAADAARWAIIHSWVEARRQQWSAMPSATRPATITILLGALGEGLPSP